LNKASLASVALQRKGFEKTKFFLTLKTSKACFLRQGKGFANLVCKT